MKNKMLRRLFARLLRFSLIFVAFWPAVTHVEVQAQAAYREDRILVKPKPGADLDPLHAQLGVQVLRTYPDNGSLQVLLLPAGSTVPAMIAAYEESGLVEYAEPDFIVQAQAAYREDRILVKPKPGADLDPLHTTLGIQVLRTYPAIGNLQVLQLAGDNTVPGTIAAYQQSGLVEYAEPDFIIQGLVTPNDPHLNDGWLWGLHNTGQFGGTPDGDIDAPEAWDILHDAGTVTVAVIDSGIRATHEDLAANLWVNAGETGPDILGLDKRFNGKDDDGNGYIDDVNGINAILGSGSPIDDQGHGTHVSGTVGAVGNNGVGVVGVAWRVQLMSLKFLDALLNGSISDAIECIDYARVKNAKIINASWGWYGITSDALYDAIESAGNAGIIFVAGCGNSAINNDVNPLYPASFDLDNIIAVAATTRSDQMADWSSYGATTVDLGAPGEEIPSCTHLSDFSYNSKSGTSMAAPHVAGACALLWSRNPTDGYSQVINRVLSSTDPQPSLSGKCVTGGRLNLQKALSASDEPLITLSNLDPEAFETGSDSGVIRLNRIGDPAQQIEVHWTVAGTAVNGSDFNQLPTSSPLTAAQLDLTITPTDDLEIEGNETVVITLVDGPGYQVGSPNSVMVTIADNDPSLPPLIDEPVITLSALDPEAFESGSDSGVIRFTRTGSPLQEIEVYWTFSGTAVNGSDFERLPTNSPFPIGNDAHLTITPIDDTTVEGTETVTVTLVDGPGYRVGSPSSATVTIGDNDQSSPALADEPVISLSDLDPEAFETGQDSGVIRFSRTGDPTQAIEVHWTFSGSAVNGSDFNQLPTSSPFPTGNEAYLTITPIDDTELEGNETVTVTLVPGPGYRVGSPSSATVTIVDNDESPPADEPVISLSDLDPEAFEAGSDTGIIRFSRTGSPVQEIEVYWTFSGSAVNGSDFAQQPTNSPFPIGTHAYLTITPIDDPEFEGTETVIVTLVDGPGYRVGSPSSATVTIGDNDPPPASPPD